LEKAVAAEPNLAVAVSLLGVMDAGLGRKEEAIREGKHACELLPISKDAIDGSFIAANLAQILAWTGEKSAATEQLQAVERVPNILSYGQLKLQPMWDDLRGDPRFEKLVADLATKEF
jgi:Flp pilus assembly protein TadD